MPQSRTLHAPRRLIQAPMAAADAARSGQGAESSILRPSRALTTGSDCPSRRTASAARWAGQSGPFGPIAEADGSPMEQKLKEKRYIQPPCHQCHVVKQLGGACKNTWRGANSPFPAKLCVIPVQSPAAGTCARGLPDQEPEHEINKSPFRDESPTPPSTYHCSRDILCLTMVLQCVEI